MTNPLKFTPEQLAGLDRLRSHGDMLVPVDWWNRYIEAHPKISEEDRPPAYHYEGFVLTDRESLVAIVQYVRNLHIERKLLLSHEGGIWLVTKLEPKKRSDHVDIFDAGKRQDGSFRSKS